MKIVNNGLTIVIDGALGHFPEEFVKSALEKQIPKKLRKEIWVDDEKHKGDVRLATENDILTKDNHSVINYCPCCDMQPIVVKYLSPPRYDLYCRKCGQALDWGETK